MSETPRDQRELWHEVSRTFEEFGEALRMHLSPDAARTPTDPTAGGAEPAPWADPAESPGRPGDSAGAADSDWVGAAGSDSAPWSDPRPGDSEGFDDAWAAATDTPPRAGTPGPGTPGPGTPGPGAPGPDTPASAGGAPTSAADAGTTGMPPTEPAGAADTTGTGPDASGAGGAGAGGAGAGGAGAGGAGAGGAGAGGARERGWRDWAGTSGGGRFASPADWDSARESVLDLGNSVRRIATQAGDAARDPHVRDSAQRAARSLGDAIVTTVEDIAAELRDRMRNPRWTDTSRPPEPPPVAPIEGNRDDKP